MDTSHAPRPHRFRWLKRLTFGILLLLGLITGLILGVRAYFDQLGKTEFQVAAAELDQQDPGWRYEEIIVRRDEVPEGQNSAPVILAAAKLLPRDWPERSGIISVERPTQQRDLASEEPWFERLKKVESTEMLEQQLVVALRA